MFREICCEYKDDIYIIILVLANVPLGSANINSITKRTRISQQNSNLSPNESSEQFLASYASFQLMS